MELFLNLLWLLIAAGVVCVWRTCWLRQKTQKRREPLREWTAMGCALVLLFFAVSLTDDLHSEVMLLEDRSTSRRHSICSHHSHSSKRIIREVGPAALPQMAMLDSPRLAPRIASTVLYPSPSVSHDLRCGRAPPIANL
jgi:hypothetical protein